MEIRRDVSHATGSPELHNHS